MSGSSTSRPGVHVVGVGMTRFGRHDGVGDLDLGAQAVRAALDDAGLTWPQVDLAVGGTNGDTKPDNLVARLGLTGLPFLTVRNGCATGAVALLTAANAVVAGEARVAVVVGYDNHARGAFGSAPSRYGLPDWYGRSGLMVTTQFFALKIRRYLHDHGLDEDVLARVAVKAFRHGAAHPNAWRRTVVDLETVRSAAPVNPPLNRLMFCSPGAGATALVLARGDVAADLCPSPVRLAAVTLRGRRFGSFELFSPWLPPGERSSPTTDAAAAAFARAGIVPGDVEVAQLQDTDAGAEVIHLAETGLCAHGEQQVLLESGATDVDGALPVNTDGGLLANGEPIGASGLRQVHEVVRQLQGRAEGLAVPGSPRVGFTQVYGSPGISACCVLVRD